VSALFAVFVLIGMAVSFFSVVLCLDQDIRNSPHPDLMYGEPQSPSHAIWVSTLRYIAEEAEQLVDAQRVARWALEQTGKAA
jgi:hypothetical protein